MKSIVNKINCSFLVAVILLSIIAQTIAPVAAQNNPGPGCTEQSMQNMTCQLTDGWSDIPCCEYTTNYWCFYLFGYEICVPTVAVCTRRSNACT